ncbi:MAG: DegQ family serine endoprotease [Simkaniaceae bacterium]|nr:DegQ family serine endoprotease [Simkaniaceae bacterium]
MKQVILATLLSLSMAQAPAGLFSGKEQEVSRAPSAQTNPARQLSRAFTQVAKESIPSVVYIHAESNGSPYGYQTDPNDFFNDDFFHRFFGPPGGRREKRESQGSGFVISEDGYILTNFHVVRDANKITIDLHDPNKKEIEAVLVGGDPKTDIAVIKIEEKNLPYLTFANSDDVEVGEWAIAVGSPFQLEASVTVGVVSAKGRQNLQITDLEDFIQTDAAINPGNSGGPLLDLDGKIIGMNTAIVSRSGGYMGIGFAIPSNILVTVKDQIIQNGEVIRGFLGVSLQPIDNGMAEALQLKTNEGALIAQVVADSPADKAGIEQGDVILKMNGRRIKSPASLRNEILLMKPGTKVELTISRRGKTLNIPVTVGSQESATGTMSDRARKLGLTVQELTPELSQQYGYRDERGVIVKDVAQSSPASAVGIRRGALIMAVNHRKVTTVDEFIEALDSVEGSRVLMLVNIKGAVRFVSVRLPK